MPVKAKMLLDEPELTCLAFSFSGDVCLRHLSCSPQAFASILDSATLLSEFHSLLIQLSDDEMDSVRLLIVQSCVQIFKVYAKEPTLEKQQKVSEILPS